MNWLNKWVIDAAQTIVTVACAVACVLIAVLGFLGLSLGFEKNTLFVLGLMPLISFMMMLKLRNIEKRLSEEARFINKSSEVMSEMVNMCSLADDYILAVGSRAKQPLLKAIEKTILRKEVFYRRLLTSNEGLLEDLESHIGRIQGLGNQCIKYLAMKDCHCPNFLLTDKKVMILLPIPESGKFRGVLLNSQEAISQYYEYFTKVFNNEDAKPYEN
jgi:hypothetical protein